MEDGAHAASTAAQGTAPPWTNNLSPPARKQKKGDMAECQIAATAWRGDGNMAAPAVPHILLWLQIVLRSRHPFQVVRNSLLAKAIGEYGTDSIPRKQVFVAGDRSVLDVSLQAVYILLRGRGARRVAHSG